MFPVKGRQICAARAGRHLVLPARGRTQARVVVQRAPAHIAHVEGLAVVSTTATTSQPTHVSNTCALQRDKTRVACAQTPHKHVCDQENLTNTDKNCSDQRNVLIVHAVRNSSAHDTGAVLILARVCVLYSWHFRTTFTAELLALVNGCTTCIAVCWKHV